jgi:hypothetical protein
MMKKYNFDEVPADEKLLEEATIRGELDIETLVFRQIERTSQSASQDEALFASNVRILMSYLPSHKREEITMRADEYSSIQKKYEYKYNCNVPMGTPEEPVCGSPYVIEEEVIDWHLLFQILMDVFEECGVTWKFEKWTVEIGAVEEKEKVLPMPAITNRFKNAVAEELAMEQAPQREIKHGRACAICRKHVNPGTGCYYKSKQMTSRKIVHKDGCLEIAKIRWGE